MARASKKRGAKRSVIKKVSKKKRGKGFVNTVLNKLPFEMHLPGYQYCGPGTKLAERVKRGDPGINPLDAACKEHDIAYSRNRENVAGRNVADKILADKAGPRVFAKDASLGEKVAAWAVANTMKAKAKLGLGMRPITLRKVIRAAKSTMKRGNDERKVIASALRGARKAVRGVGRRNVRRPRVLPVPKIGGILPLLPIFAGLSALGALAGGAAGVAKAVNAARDAKAELEESKRHNRMMEAVALGKGLHLKPYKEGLGLYLKPAKNGE